MIIPVVLGMLISYALDPMVTALTRLRIARPVAAAILLLSLVGGGGLGCINCGSRRGRSPSNCLMRHDGCVG